MPFLSCLPCFKDKDTRHSTEYELEKPIPVEKIVNNSNDSAAKPSTSVPTPSNAVTFSSDKGHLSNDQSTSTQAVTYADQKPVLSNLADSNNAVTFNNDRQSEANNGPAPETNVSALKDREPSTSTKEQTDPNSIYATSHVTMADLLKNTASGVTDTVSSGAQQAGSAASSGAQQAGSAASSGAEKVQGAASSNPVSSGPKKLRSGASSGAEKVQSTASTGTDKATGATSGATSGKQDWEAMTEDQKKATFDALPEGSEQKKMGYYEWVKQGFYNQKSNWMPWIEDQYLRWFTSDNKASYATKDYMDKSKVTGIEQVDTLQDSVNSTVSSQVGQGGLLQPVGDAVSKEGVNRAERGGKDDGGSYLGTAGGYVSGAGGSVLSGAKSAGGYVTGMFSGKKDDATSESK